MAAMDILGGLYTGTSGKQHSFVAFVTDFLPKTYPAGRLWKLRCAVLHNYQLTADVMFVLAPQLADRHLTVVNELGPGGLLIHGARLTDDVDSAAEHLILRARQDPEVANRLIRHARRHLLMMGGI